MLSDSILAFLHAHLALFILVGQATYLASVASSYLAPKLKDYPRISGALLLVSAVALDVRKAVAAIQQIVSGEIKIPDPKEIFEVYNGNAGGVNFAGAKTPPWEELPAKIQDNWRAVAKHVALRNL